MGRAWDIQTINFVETPSEMQEFFDDIRKVYEKYNLCISHEDEHGSFIIEKYNNDWHGNMLWLEQAHKGY